MRHRCSIVLSLLLASAMIMLGDTVVSPARVGAQRCKAACYLRVRAASSTVRLDAAISQPIQGATFSSRVRADLSRRGPGQAEGLAAGRLRASVTMVTTAGWNGRYRASGAWVPVRVTMHNRGPVAISGALSIATPSVLDPMENRPARDVSYEVAVLLLADATRQVTLYVPGRAVPDRMTVTFKVGHTIVTSNTLFPTAVADQDITVGVLTGDPSVMTWLGHVRVPGAKTDAIRLTPADLDPVPQVLAAFDVIVVTNVNSELLDKRQLKALEQYVRSGGALVTVGGPDWQETLRPLPSVLVPGRLHGSATIQGLTGLDFFQSGVPPHGATVVSLLRQTTGSAIASPGGIPLVVRTALGVGRLEYLAFDPAVNPVARWSGSGGLLTKLLTSVAVEAMRRLSLPSGFNLLSFRDPGPARLDPTRNAVSVPVPTSPPIPMGVPIFLVFMVAYVALLGPFSYFALQRFRRHNAAWFTPPLLGLVIFGAVVILARHASGATAVVGAVSAVEIDGAGSGYSADSYLRVLSLSPGTRTVALDATALAAAIPVVVGGPPSFTEATKTRWVLREGAQPQAVLPSLGTWSSRFLDVQTTDHLTGKLTEHLHLNRDGEIVGLIHNGTSVRIVHPAIVAGQAYEHLPDLAPGASARVRLTPQASVLDNRYRQALYELYGRIAGSDGRQIQDAVMMLPETNAVSMVGEVIFLGWSRGSVNPVKVDGVQPRRVDMSLILKPLSVGFPSGSFDLLQGTLGAYPLDEVAVTPRYACCNPSVQGIFMGVGASTSFEFDLPRPGHVHPQSLSLAVFAGGPDTTYTGYTDMPAHTASVYDWRSRRWFDLTFTRGTAHVPHPADMISPSGALLVRVRASDRSGDLAFFDPHHDLQLSGHLIVR